MAPQQLPEYEPPDISATHLQAALFVDNTERTLYATEHPGSHRLNVNKLVGQDWRELFPEFEQIEIESQSSTDTFFFISTDKDGPAYRVRKWAATPLPGTGGGHFILVEAIGNPSAVDELIYHERMIALGQIAAGVAHEINNPLTTVSGWLQILLAETEPDDRRRAPLQLISAEATRIANIVQHLLSFGRRAPSEDTLVHADTLLSDVLALVEYQMRSDNIELLTEHCAGIPPVIGDPNQLRQVFLNIVVNARHAMPNGGRLTVQTQVGADGGAEISFTDTGCGMTSEIAQRIFDPFFTTKSDNGGSGVGLFLCRNIVRDHRGTLSVSSRPGEGSTFLVRLPAAQTQQISLGNTAVEMLDARPLTEPEETIMAELPAIPREER